MDTRLGEFEQLLLFALLRLGEDAYGVTLRREIETRTSRAVSAGAVYTAMERLEARGFVSSFIGAPTPQRGGKRKKYYRLEQAGARALTRSYKSLHEMAKGVLPDLARVASNGLGK
jgi:DNA-binding PadR family transcriptional regulator